MFSNYEKGSYSFIDCFDCFDFGRITFSQLFFQEFNWFWINVLGGFAYHTHTKTSGIMDSKLAPRFGLELKFNVFRKYIGLLLKGAISPFEGDYEGFIGIGISVGYFM